jgi:DNA-binding CsgD family transcriptional regulator/predicted enzyme related to lactoylglutathione lyase
MTARRGRGRPPHPDLLTPAEWEVLDWVRHGVRRAEIARRRGTSIDAVKYHLGNISGKLGVATRDLRHWPGVPALSTLRSTRPTTSRSTDPTMTSTAVGRDTALQAIGQVSLSIREVERATRFYGELLGLPHLFTFGDLAFFDAGGVRLYLHRKDEVDWQPGSVLYFVVGDIQAAVESLSSRGVAFSGAPHRVHTHDDGTEEWMAFFPDGEGNTLALMSRIVPAG